MRHYPLMILLGLALLLQLSVASAGRGDSFFEDKGTRPEQESPFVEAPEWKEIGIKLPAYPKDGDLIDLHLDSPGNKLQYFMDEKSIAVSKQDHVVRYTVVIESARGTRNIFYEGIRCDVEEYKTYAFGSGKQKLRPGRNPEWKPVTGRGYAKFRIDLIEYYLCEWKLPRKPNVIINKIKHATPSEVGRRWHDL